MLSLSELGASLRGLKRVLLATHIAPDPDALGSCFGLALGLQSIGMEVLVYCADGVLAKMEPYLKGVPRTEVLPAGKFDALVVVDTASKSRVAGASEELFALSTVVINIDHHISNPAWGTVNYIDVEAPASALIVFELLEAMRVEVTSPIAWLLYAGLIDDTGCFRYSNTSSRALEVAARLVARGAQPSSVSNVLYFNVPVNVLRLRSEAMSGMRLVVQNRVVLVVVTKALLNHCAATPADTEGIVDEARLIEGTDAAVFIREMDDGWKCSLRAKNELLDVNRIAGVFGGGGHRAASGCKLHGSQQEVESTLLAEFEKELNALDAT